MKELHFITEYYSIMHFYPLIHNNLVGGCYCYNKPGVQIPLWCTEFIFLGLYSVVYLLDYTVVIFLAFEEYSDFLQNGYSKKYTLKSAVSCPFSNT